MSTSSFPSLPPQTPTPAGMPPSQKQVVPEAQVTLRHLTDAKVEAVSTQIKVKLGGVEREMTYQAGFNGTKAQINKKTLDELGGQTRLLLEAASKFYESQKKSGVASASLALEQLKKMETYDIKPCSKTGGLVLEVHSPAGLLIHPIPLTTRIEGDYNPLDQTGTRGFIVEDYLRELQETIQSLCTSKNPTDQKFAQKSGWNFLQHLIQNFGIYGRQRPANAQNTNPGESLAHLDQINRMRQQEMSQGTQALAHH